MYVLKKPRTTKPQQKYPKNRRFRQASEEYLEGLRLIRTGYQSSGTRILFIMFVLLANCVPEAVTVWRKKQDLTGAGTALARLPELLSLPSGVFLGERSFYFNFTERLEIRVQCKIAPGPSLGIFGGFLF